MTLNDALVQHLVREGLDGGNAVQAAYVVQQATALLRTGGHEDQLQFAGMDAPQACYSLDYHGLTVTLWHWRYGRNTLLVLDQDREVLVSTLTPCTTEHDTDMWTGDLLDWQPGAWLETFGTLVLVAGVGV